MDPAMVSQFPPGYLEQYDGQQLINVAVTFGVLETLFVALFYSARILSKAASGPEMWLMPIAYLFCFSHTIIIALLLNYGGAGHHIEVVTAEQMEIWRKLIFAEEMLYVLSATMPKLVILCLYQRIFTTKPYRYATYVIGGVMVANYIVNIVLALAICKPVAFSWDKTIPGGTCGDLRAAYSWISVPNLLTDILILILPLPIILNLHISRNQKIGLTFTFITGSIGIVTSALRFASFFQLNVYLDPTYLVATTMTWTVVEPGVYLIAACLPSMRPLLHLAFKNIDFSTVYSRLRNTVGSSTRQTTDIPLSTRKGTSSTSSRNSSHRDGFHNLKGANVNVTEDYGDDMQKLVKPYEKYGQRTEQV